MRDVPLVRLNFQKHSELKVVSRTNPDSSGRKECGRPDREVLGEMPRKAHERVLAEGDKT